ncbi:MAG TPA: hypothetical protein VGJ95_13650 [Pseudonocardiaceae bacterium]|jgi:hypothetical protein
MTDVKPNAELDVPVGLVEVSVNFTVKAWEAVEAAAANEGNTCTDTINRAVQVYEVLTRIFGPRVGKDEG